MKINPNIIELEQDIDGIFKPSGKIYRKSYKNKDKKTKSLLKDKRYLSYPLTFDNDFRRMTQPLDEFLNGVDKGLDLLDKFFGKRK